MARPATKQDLEALAKENYQKLVSLIEALSDKEREKAFPEGTMNRNIRDVIGHLYHWHLLFLNWYEVGMRGEKPKIPKEGYTFSDTSKLNRVKECHLLRCAHFLKPLITKYFNLYRNTQMRSFSLRKSITGRGVLP